MGLSAERASSFEKGDLVLNNTEIGFIYRGHINIININENGELSIECAWLASNDGTPDNPADTWVVSINRPVSMRFCILETSERVGELSFSLPFGERLILHAPNGNKLNPARVKGLRL